MAKPAGQVELSSPVGICPFLPPSRLPISPLAKSLWPTFWISDYTSRISLWSFCVCFDRWLCQTCVLQRRLSFMLTVLLSRLPSHHICQQRSQGRASSAEGGQFYWFGWCLPSVFLNRAFSPLPKPLPRMLFFKTWTCCMRFPFSWDSLGRIRHPPLTSTADTTAISFVTLHLDYRDIT